jgi:hypothetical protein
VHGGRSTWNVTCTSTQRCWYRVDLFEASQAEDEFPYLDEVLFLDVAAVYGVHREYREPIADRLAAALDDLSELSRS